MINDYYGVNKIRGINVSQWKEWLIECKDNKFLLKCQVIKTRNLSGRIFGTYKKLLMFLERPVKGTLLKSLTVNMHLRDYWKILQPIL